MLIAALVPCGLSTAGGTRGEKKPGTPERAASAAPVSLKTRRELSSLGSGRPGSQLDTPSQKARTRSTRRSSELPAMIAELMAPIETPATQLGISPASDRAS